MKKRDFLKGSRKSHPPLPGNALSRRTPARTPLLGPLYPFTAAPQALVDSTLSPSTPDSLLGFPNAHPALIARLPQQDRSQRTGRDSGLRQRPDGSRAGQAPSCLTLSWSAPGSAGRPPLSCPGAVHRPDCHMAFPKAEVIGKPKDEQEVGEGTPETCTGRELPRRYLQSLVFEKEFLVQHLMHWRVRVP